MCNCSQIEILYNEKHSWTQLRVLQRFCLAFCGGNMVSDGEHNSSGCLVIAALFQSLTKNGKSFSISYPSRKILVRSKWFKMVEHFANQNWPCSSWGCPLHTWGRPSCRGRRWHSPRSKESTGGESLRNIRNQGFAISGPGKHPFHQLQSLTLCVAHGVGEHLLGVDHVVGQHRTLLPDPFLGEAVLRRCCTSYRKFRDKSSPHHHLEVGEKGRRGWVVLETWSWSALLVNTHTRWCPHSGNRVADDRGGEVGGRK